MNGQDDTSGFSAFMQKEKAAVDEIKTRLPPRVYKLIAIPKDELDVQGLYTPRTAANSDDWEDRSYRVPDIFDDDYLDYYSEWSRENPDDTGDSYGEWLNKKFTPPQDPVKLFNEYPQGQRLAKDLDIYHEHDYIRKQNRKINVASNLYFMMYDLIKKNYPEDYEKGAIEAEKMIEVVVHFVTFLIRDIVEAAVYDADGALELFYAHLGVNYQYLCEHSKLEKTLKPREHIKTIRLWRY